MGSARGCGRLRVLVTLGVVVVFHAAAAFAADWRQVGSPRKIALPPLKMKMKQKMKMKRECTEALQMALQFC